MRIAAAIGAVLALTPLPALAGDAEAGRNVFERQCVACHVIVNEAGETLAGRNARTGPNLYGVVGRQAGQVEGFRYGASLVEAGNNGLVWDEANLAAYLQDTTGYLRSYLNNNRARSNMTYRVRSAEDAENVAAYLATFSPAAEN